jgi:alpha-L-rhamnosidase
MKTSNNLIQTIQTRCSRSESQLVNLIKPDESFFSIRFVIGFAICGFGASYAGNTALASKKTTQENPPNIIFILTDDQRWDALGYAGNEIIVTPEMDRLAREGAYFEYGMVSTPICSASRASIFTGLYERTHKYTFQTSDILHEYMEQSYPALLKNAGYHTGFFGKFGVNFATKSNLFDVIDDYDRNNRFHDYRGFFYKTIDSDTVHLTRYTGQQALDFIDDAPKDQPFCLSLSFSAPHAHDPAPLQWFWTEESDHLFRDMVMPAPLISDDRYFVELPQAVREGFNRLRWGWRFDTPEKYQHSIKGYYRMIHDIDLEIAKIRARLKDQGLDKNTVIIVMGDNGFYLGERQLAGKWLMHDNSIRVPLIIYDPRVGHSVDSKTMALNIDVPATILDLAGVEVPQTYHGVSLMPLVSRSGTFDRDTVLIEHLWEFEHIPPSEGIRTNEWKYFRYVNDHSLEELYYLPDDPLEVHNLAADLEYQNVLRTMRNQLNNMIDRYADPYSGVPAGLTTEYIKDPSGTRITTPTPLFGWIVPIQAEIQQGYQILVASTIENIEKNIGDVWDSQVVRERQSNNVEYNGTPLQENTSYYWKVRIFDKHNRISGYSKPQRFITGTFDKSPFSHNYFRIELINPVIHKQLEDGSFFYDFGKAAFATLNVKHEVSEAETLTIRLGEKETNGRVDRNPGGLIRYQEVKLEVVPGKTDYQIELVPDKRNTENIAVSMPDSFPVIFPFRFVEIEGASKMIDPANLQQEAYFNYFEEESSSFESSNDILNQVWGLCKYSMKATTFAGYYVDGDRERIPYEADAYINQLSHYGVDNEYAIGRKTIEYFFDSRPTWPTEWQLHVAMLMYQDYMYTGNARLIETFYERLKYKTLMDLEVDGGFISTDHPNHNDELMLKLGFPDTSRRLRDIVDWPPPANNFGGHGGVQMGERDGYVFKPINTVVNGFYYHNMKIMARFAELLDKPDEAFDFEFRAARVKKSINDNLFDEERGYYVDGVGTDHASLHANMILLAFDVVPESRKKSVVEHIKSRGMACSVYGAQYLLEALYKAGEAEYAFELMTATHDRSWYNMIQVGSTITMEAWDMKYKTNLDWNHAWGAAPANIIPRYLWGIRPAKPGFDLITIQPQPTPLQNTSIVVPTIKGPVKASYEMVTNRLKRYRVEIPANTGAVFTPPIADNEVVTLNGVKMNPVFGSIRLDPGVNYIEIRVHSF